MEKLSLKPPPIGITIFRRAPSWLKDVPLFRGLSYCQAVAETDDGGELRVEPSSITTCHWVPAVLGLKEAELDFEKELTPRLESGTVALYLARLDRYRPGLEPDVVVLRADPDVLKQLIEHVGWDHAAWDYVEDKRVSRSALRHLREPESGWRSRLLKPVNRSLAGMRRVPGWTEATALAFRSMTVTKAFDQIIKRAMADMSICRNSTVIPYQSGKVNVSYFCTGGIAWGGNDPFHLTSGWPWPLWRQIADRVEW